MFDEFKKFAAAGNVIDLAVGVIVGGMIPKVDSAVKALKEGVRRVHFIDGRVPHALLLEVFTDKGIGTEIIHG